MSIFYIGMLIDSNGKWNILYHNDNVSTSQHWPVDVQRVENPLLYLAVDCCRPVDHRLGIFVGVTSKR